jgi:leucyl/phenylalanyl-tRNA--protein transferase
LPYFELSKDELTFPPAYFADLEGLLAVGGDMNPDRLLLAYNNGIYYWHFPLKHIKWWSPDPRTVILLNSFEFPEKRFAALQNQFKVTFNKDFEQVLRLCQQVYNLKDNMDNTWLSERAFRTFLDLYDKGYAYSIEVWSHDQIVGGLFGITIGKLFFGEYKFTLAEHADEFALLNLINKLKAEHFQLIDMQKPTIFFEGITYDELSRIEYVGICKKNAEDFAIKKHFMS